MHCTNYTLPNTEAALQCCSAMDTLCREVINGVPIAIGQPECIYIYNIYIYTLWLYKANINMCINCGANIVETAGPNHIKS